MSTTFSKYDGSCIVCYQGTDTGLVSESTIRRALRATDPAVFPPPLRAKRKGPGEKAQIVIHRTVLDSWFESWPDAS